MILTRILVIAAVCLASQVGAQTAREQAFDLIEASTAGAGFAPDLAAAIAECFASRLTIDEAEALLAAEDVEAQQAVTEGMAEYQAAVACAAEAFL